MLGLFLEDLEEGQVFSSRGRTVTETDIVNFAGLSGDFNPIHLDQEAAARGRYGRPVAHGVLTISMVTGLIDSLGLFQQTMIAMLGINEWNFRLPVFAGDTIRLRMKILSIRRTSSGDRGIVVRGLEVLNQRDELVQSGSITVMVKARDHHRTDGHTTSQIELEA